MRLQFMYVEISKRNILIPMVYTSVRHIFSVILRWIYSQIYKLLIASLFALNKLISKMFYRSFKNFKWSRPFFYFISLSIYLLFIYYNLSMFRYVYRTYGD